MAASDDFKEAIRAGRLADALVLAMGNAVELKIATWVVSAADAAVSNPLPGHRLQTRINLIGGEIENEVGDRFIGNGPYTELQKYHHQQVLEGNKTIQKNLQSLSALFQVLIALQQHQANPNEPLSLVDIEIPALPQAPAPTIPTAVQGNDVAMSELDSLAIAATDSQGLDSWENLAVVTPARSESPETPAIPEVPLPEAPVSELEIEDWEGIATTRDSENELGAIADEELFIAETVMPPTATAADSEIPEETMLTWDEDAIDEIATEISAAAPPVLDLPSTTESDDWEVFEEVEISDAVEPVSLEFEVPEDSWDEFEETPPVLDDSGTEVVMADEEEAIAPETSLELPSDLESPEDWSDFEDTFSHPELATAESADLLQPGVETTKAVADDFELSGEEENREAESMAVAMPDLADDWSGFEEETTPETTPELAIEEDWSGFEQESVAPDVPSLALEDEAEDWGDFEEETTPETTPELAIEED
ncbi:MAG: hypothetical protein SAJ72_16505, partial [Jaaginema sp. PMC 1080.18]|nr:hypothetical protein [Jaaginema sp. PMC 1080.18]